MPEESDFFKIYPLADFWPGTLNSPSDFVGFDPISSSVSLAEFEIPLHGCCLSSDLPG